MLMKMKFDKILSRLKNRLTIESLKGKIQERLTQEMMEYTLVITEVPEEHTHASVF